MVRLADLMVPDGHQLSEIYGFIPYEGLPNSVHISVVQQIVRS